jgi:hypothetical protein
MLMAAAENGNADSVKALISAGADVNAKDNDVGTALHYAAHKGHKDVAQLLLANKASVNAKGDRGMAPLHFAAREGDWKMAQLLLANGADVCAKCGDGGWTPLHYAARNGQEDVAKLLLDCGADVSARNESGETPLDVAEGKLRGSDLLVHARRSHAAKIDLIDWRSEEEKKLERAAAVGDVPPSTEDHATRLLALWRATEFDFYWKGPGERMVCNECNATKAGRFPLTPVDDGFICKSCGRRVVLDQFVIEDGEHYKHKGVIEIGQRIAQAGGSSAMQAAAYRFNALGERMSDLSRCWHGVGGWMH